MASTAAELFARTAGAPPARLAPAGLFTWPMAATFVLLATTPFWLAAIGLYQYLALEIVIWMLFALGYNLLLGQAGLPSFGHGAYFGVGAYGYGLAQKLIAANLWVDLGLAVLAATLAGAIVAAFISHRRGIYYALLTIAFGQVFWFVAIKWHSVTGGEDGLLNLKRLPADFGVAAVSLGSNEALFYFTFAVFALVVVGLWRLVHSPFGRILHAVKQNEMRAAFVGHNVWLYKWLAFVISAAIAGLAGALFAMAQQSAYPNVMSLHNSGFVVMMVLIGGGLVSFWGPVIGAAFFILARDLLGAYTETWLLWYGLAFMAMVLFKPEGIAGIWQQFGQAFSPADAMTPLFEARRLSKRFGDAVVLEDVNLAFAPGRLAGIMGPNGAGKTTCFNCLTGRYRPDRGEVWFAGENITGLSPREVARRGIARSFQVMNLFDETSALENVLVALPGLRARGFDFARDAARATTLVDEAAAVLARVGLRGKELTRAKSLSYGERRALEIAVALAARPRLLFLDEPTAGLGAEGTTRLADLVRELRRDLTIVIIEHDMRFLFGLADEISVIHWGQVIARGSPDELRANPWVQRSNLGELG